MPRGDKLGSLGLVPIHVTYGANAAVLDGFVFVAPNGSAYELVGVTEVHDVAGSDGGAVTVDVVRCAAGTTVASGTTMLTSTFDAKSTADTPVEKTISNGGVHQTYERRILSAGQAIALNFTGTLTALVGVAVTLWLKPIRRPSF